jgi:hypothetical protein
MDIAMIYIVILQVPVTGRTLYFLKATWRSLSRSCTPCINDRRSLYDCPGRPQITL